MSGFTKDVKPIIDNLGQTEIILVLIDGKMVEIFFKNKDTLLQFLNKTMVEGYKFT